MTLPRAAEPAARLSLAAAAVLTSFYALLCYLPTTWKFMESRFYPAWVSVFVRWHPLGCGVALALAGWVLWRKSRDGARAAAACFSLSHAALAAWIAWRPLSGLGSDRLSLLWSVLAWEPLLAWEALLARGASAPLEWERRLPEEDPRVLHAALGCALLTYAGFTAAFLAAHPGYPFGDPAAAALALCWSLALHAMLFLGVYAWWGVLRELAGLCPEPVQAETTGLFASLWLAAFLAVKETVLRPLVFSGPLPSAFSALCAAGLTAALYGECRRAQGRLRAPVASGLRFAAAPVAALRLWAAARPAQALRLRSAQAAVLLAVSCALAAAAAAAGSGLDWNHLFQTLLVFLAWGLLFACLYCAAGTGPERSPALAPRVLIGACLALAWGSAAAVAGLRPRLAARGLSLSGILGGYEAHEPSFRTARRLFMPHPGQASFYAYLRRSAFAPGGARMGSVDLRLVDRLGPGIARKPHIFLFVIDSLRQDYVGAYNPAARSTPAIDALAADGVVMRKAFTDYGGTVLAQPALWTGALLPHARYAEPFHPLNSLEKLLEHEGYQRFLAMDVVLEAILKRLPDDAPLDPGALGINRLCGTLEDLTRKLDARRPGSSPVFVYAQPHDLHISILNAPYAARLKAMDACLGRFIGHLKARGLYEDSVIILTADHGDSLGENGRWGHGFSLYPEVLRIPLIVRAPARLLKGLRRDPRRAAFLTDITPTLYALLGQGPIRSGALFGSPLFAPAGGRAEADRRQGRPRLVASSYGPVYGLLKEEGRYLYVADALDRSAHYFDLERDPAGTRDLVDEAVEAENDALIRAAVEEIARFYWSALPGRGKSGS